MGEKGVLYSACRFKLLHKRATGDEGRIWKTNAVVGRDGGDGERDSGDLRISMVLNTLEPSECLQGDLQGWNR